MSLERLSQSIQRIVTIGGPNMAMLASQAASNTNRWCWHLFQSAVSRFVQELVFVHKKEIRLPLTKWYPIIWNPYLYIYIYLCYIKTKYTSIGETLSLKLYTELQLTGNHHKCLHFEPTPDTLNELTHFFAQW